MSCSCYQQAHNSERDEQKGSGKFQLSPWLLTGPAWLCARARTSTVACPYASSGCGLQRVPPCARGMAFCPPGLVTPGTRGVAIFFSPCQRVWQPGLAGVV